MKSVLETRKELARKAGLAIGKAIGDAGTAVGVLVQLFAQTKLEAIDREGRYKASPPMKKKAVPEETVVNEEKPSNLGVTVASPKTTPQVKTTSRNKGNMYDMGPVPPRRYAPRKSMTGSKGGSVHGNYIDLQDRKFSVGPAGNKHKTPQNYVRLTFSDGEIFDLSRHNFARRCEQNMYTRRTVGV